MIVAWRRRLYGGLGAAVLAPAMLIASLAVVAAAGGFGSLSDFSQAFAGPPPPSAASSAAGVLRGLARPAAVPVAVRTASAGAVAGGAAPAGASAPAPSPGAPGTGQGGGSGSGSGGGSGSGSGSGAGSGGGGSGGFGGGTGSGGSGGGGGQPTLINQIATTGAALTGQVPPPLGPALTQQVGSAASTVSGLVPGGGHSAR